MKNYIVCVFCCVLCIVMCSCQVNIAELPIVAHDMQTYDNKVLAKKSTQPKEVKRIAIVPEKGDMNEIKTKLSNSLRSEFESLLIDFSHFNPIPRSEIPAIIKNNKFNTALGLDAPMGKIEGTDCVLVFSLLNYSMRKSTDFMTKVFQGSTLEKGYLGHVKIKTTIIDLKSGQKIFSKTISGVSKSSANVQHISESNETMATLNEAIEVATKNFIHKLSMEYSTLSYITLQTKGNGKVALVSMGSKDGLSLNSKVEFYIIRKNGTQEIKIPFAYGVVKEVELDRAWVVVKNHLNAKVLTNHFVRIRASH